MAFIHLQSQEGCSLLQGHPASWLDTLQPHDLINPFLLAFLPVQPKEMGLPVHAYMARDEVREDGTEKSRKVFVNLPTEVGATEAEEIGVEHLLRDVKDAAVSSLATEVRRPAALLRCVCWARPPCRRLVLAVPRSGMVHTTA
jgi:hypothetical protein